MRRQRLALLMGSVTVALFATIGLGHSDGANPNTAQQGCTCHGPGPSSSVQVAITGLPERYEPLQTYDLTFTLTGPEPLPAPAGQNRGGFAVSVDGGVLASVDDKTQLREGTLTHTEAGNDQRTWPFRWTAPEAANVTFRFAGNAVNGDQVNSGLDSWNKGQMEVGRVEAVSPTLAPTPTQGESETPTLSAVSVLLLTLGVAGYRRLR